MYTGARIIQKNVVTNKYRRIPLDITDDTAASAPWTGAVAGIKAQLSFNGAAEVASTNDIVRVSSGGHYVELTQAESNTESGLVIARVAGSVGVRREAFGYAELVDYDPFQAGATVAEIADANWDEARAGHVIAGTFGEGVSVIALADNIITAAKIAGDAIDASALAADAATEIASAIFGASFGANYNNYTFEQLVKLMAAVLVGVANGLDTTTANFLNLAGNAVVVSATVDSNGNRSVVTKNP